MTVGKWIEALQRFSSALEVLVRVGSDDYSVLYTAADPHFAVDAGCTETDMLCIDLIDCDACMDGVLALGPPDDSDDEVSPDDPQGILRADRVAEVDAHNHKRQCSIVTEIDLERFVVKYLGGGKDNITSNERELLLFALYNESVAREGLAKRGLDEMDERLKAQNARMNADR